MNSVSLSNSTACTPDQTPYELPDASSQESRVFIQSVTNLRELINGVIALLVPLASCRDLRLRASVGQTVAETISADSACLGQLIFHLLKRTVQLSARGEITLVVWAQDLNPSSQRIFISVVHGAGKSATARSSQLSAPLADDTQSAEQFADVDACFPFCQNLVQRMHGELSIASNAAKGPRATFNALFVVEHRGPLAGMVSGNAQAPFVPHATHLRDISASVSFEPFERRYLDALSAEGVDLKAFLDSWRQAMNDDLERLDALLRERDFDHFHGVLHRLSGAVGLVGARGLTEALRRASTSCCEHNTDSIVALSARARTLVMQLEVTSRADRNASQ